MKILILGGSGFVGTRLTEILLKDHQVTIGDIAESEKYPLLWKHCDVRSDDDLRSVLPGHDCIVNLAAAHRDDVRPVSLYMETNVDGAEHVCKIASESGIRHIVFTSSVAVYGFPKWEYDEDAPKEPFNEYGRTKLLAEEVYGKWQKSHPENRLHVVRPTVVFGEGNRGNVYNLFHQLASGRFLMVGDGKNRKSMAYVGNIAALSTTILTNLIMTCMTLSMVLNGFSIRSCRRFRCHTGLACAEDTALTFLLLSQEKISQSVLSGSENSVLRLFSTLNACRKVDLFRHILCRML